LRLEFVRQLPDPINRVWACLTESDELDGWFGSWTGDASSGEIQLKFHEAPEPGPVQILACEPPSRLSAIVPSPDGPWPLTVTLAPRSDNGTTLTFTHRLSEPYDATSVGAGWQYYLDRLNSHLHNEIPASDFDPYLAIAHTYQIPS
jgi:uncharacterized protein YndB with AHSA1/START domain